MKARLAFLGLAVALLPSPRARADEPPATAQVPAAALSAAPTVPDAPPAAAATPPRPGRYFFHASFGVNVYSFLGATGNGLKGNAQLNVLPGDTTPDRRMTFAEQIGVGYFVHEHIRLTLTAMFIETATGVPDTASKFTMLSFIPWVAYVNGGFFAGLGPLLTARAYGDWNFELGLFPVAGYGFQLGGGFTLALAVQAPVTFLQRVTVAVTPALVLGYRF